MTTETVEATDRTCACFTPEADCPDCRACLDHHDLDDCDNWIEWVKEGWH